MKIHHCDQRSEAWHALRCGKLTGSGANALLAVRKRGSGELQARADLRQRIVVERLTGVPANDIPYLPKDMQHGVTCEPEAVGAYEAATGQLVCRVGFIEHDTLATGCSPDGYVGDIEGVIEVKCPASRTHLEYLQAGVVPEDYVGQLVHAIWVTGAQWAEFISYDPRFLDPSLHLFIRRVTRKSLDLTAYELAVSLFLSEVEKATHVFQPVAQEVA